MKATRSPFSLTNINITSIRHHPALRQKHQNYLHSNHQRQYHLTPFNITSIHILSQHEIHCSEWLPFSSGHTVTHCHSQTSSMCRVYFWCLDSAMCLDSVFPDVCTMLLLAFLFCFALFILEVIVRGFCFNCHQNRPGPPHLAAVFTKMPSPWVAKR